jgi:lipase maturation factor 1
MDWKPTSLIRWLFDPLRGMRDRLISRWIFLRGLGLIYFSAFFSLVFQVRGLIGPQGILPAGEYLKSVRNSAGVGRFWYAPTLLWFSSGSHMLMALCWVGLLASLLIVFNCRPRAMLLVCFVCFLSFVGAASEFAGYQSDGMLLEAGFIALFLAPPGLRPGLAALHPPIRASVFLLLWEWFRIYFESGVAKIAGGDPEWRNFTAMDEYYQNGPLPTWIGWYAQHLPHWFHVATAFGTLALELGLVWMLFISRRMRIVIFVIATAWQAGIILTANYTFLNYLVLLLGVFLVDDRFWLQFLPQHWRQHLSGQLRMASAAALQPSNAKSGATARLLLELDRLRLALTAVILCWMFYASTTELIWMFWSAPLPIRPVVALEPFRIADRYGLFAMMTRGRYEIEFQGSRDGQTWTVYPFRYKPQDPGKAPGICAPYQPRFDWNLWFASLGGWRANPIVLRTEEKLLSNEPDVLQLFAANPFPGEPPLQVRALVWQYWFTTVAEKREQGLWWRRKLLGLYAPTLEREPDGKISVVQLPTAMEPRN